MKVVERNISELIPAEYNPRYLSEDAEAHLKASLKRFGAVDPAIINTHPDRKDIIIGGHQRLKVWKSMGNDTFPCVEVELERDKERELNIRLNKNTGAFDWDLLANYFEVEELTDWGFSEDDLFGEELEMPDELTDESEHKDAVAKITFNSPDHLQDAIPELEKLIEKYPESFISVSAGEL